MRRRRRSPRDVANGAASYTIQHREPQKAPQYNDDSLQPIDRQRAGIRLWFYKGRIAVPVSTRPRRRVVRTCSGR